MVLWKWKQKSESYYLNDQLHRENGPAYIKYYENGKVQNQRYHINGDNYGKLEYMLKISNLKKNDMCLLK